MPASTALAQAFAKERKDGHSVLSGERSNDDLAAATLGPQQLCFNVRFGSKADLAHVGSECPLSAKSGHRNALATRRLGS